MPGWQITLIAVAAALVAGTAAVFLDRARAAPPPPRPGDAPARPAQADNRAWTPARVQARAQPGKGQPARVAAPVPEHQLCGP